LSEQRAGLRNMTDFRIERLPFDAGALVIESRRPIGWSETWNDDRSGLLVYFVDTQLDVERVDVYTQGGCGTSDEQQKWAYYLYRDDFSGDCRNWFEAFIKPGDTVTHKGVSIALEFSDDELDYVVVSARADSE
jgi:hypothetical protein